MAIRFDKAYNAEINRVVRNFNQKRNRAIKRGYKYLPPLMSVSELKSRYTTRRELNRDLNALKRFNREGDKALRVVETSGGAKAIKWEYEYLKRNINYAKEFYDREISDAARLNTPMQVAKAEYLNNMKAKRAYLDLELSQLNQSQFKTFRATINEYINSNITMSNGYRAWMNEVEIIMRNLGYDNKSINKFFEGFEKLTPRQFLTMYQQNPLVSRIYELYIPTNDHSFKLSTSEEDAKELIETFVEEKDDMIMKAKAEDLDSKELDDFVKEITSEKLTTIRKQGKAKLKRNELTPEQIKKLEELGWDDLIE